MIVLELENLDAVEYDPLNVPHLTEVMMKDKRKKLFSLPRIQNLMEEAYNLFENRSVANHYKGRLTEDTFCPRESNFYAPAPGVSDWVFKNMKRWGND